MLRWIMRDVVFQHLVVFFNQYKECSYICKW